MTTKELFILIWNFKIGGVQKHAVLMSNYFLKLDYKVHILYKSNEGMFFDKVDSGVELIPFEVPNTNNPLGCENYTELCQI